jgi:hypothetical protein
VLEEIDGGDGVQVSGLSWVEGTASLPPSALATRVLCKSHNERLSRVDALGKELFVGLRARIVAAQSGHSISERLRIEAHDFGRWLLKAACAQAASDQVANLSLQPTEVPIERLWVEVIFDHKPWPTDWSVVMLWPAGGVRVITEGGGVENGWLHTNAGSVSGVDGRVQGLHFAVLFKPPPANVLGESVTRTPFSLNIQRIGSTAGGRIAFCLPGSDNVESEWVLPLDGSSTPDVDR